MLNKLNLNQPSFKRHNRHGLGLKGNLFKARDKVFNREPHEIISFFLRKQV